MSGGHFDYLQYRFEDVADQIDKLIHNNENDNGDEWGDTKGRFYSQDTIDKFRETAHKIRQTSDMVQRIDWLVCGDDGEDTFHKRWKQEVRENYEKIKH